MEIDSITGFQNRLLRPLGHTSALDSISSAWVGKDRARANDRITGRMSRQDPHYTHSHEKRQAGKTRRVVRSSRRGGRDLERLPKLCPDGMTDCFLARHFSAVNYDTRTRNRFNGFPDSPTPQTCPRNRVHL